MKYLLTICFLFIYTLQAFSQTIYSKTFGDKKDQTVIFLHGGPGNSSVFFEATTAQKLADKGFYVIIYDRRGDGRSVDKTARMNFQEAFDDLNQLYAQYGLKQATLMGFSFGGLVTAQFAEKYPQKVKSIVLVSALIDQQASYNTIITSTRQIYQQKKDIENLADLARIEKMDHNSLDYRTACFKHATANGYFKLKNPDPVAKKIYDSYPTDPLISAYVKNEQAVATFWKNESLRNIDTTPILKKLRAQKMDIYALYGKQDGLYSGEQINEIQKIAGAKRVQYLDNCAHTLFIDQQPAFLSAVSQWLKERQHTIN